MRKPTLQDVARAAGVSYATADRVLDARGNVAARSERRVREAIRTFGYTRDVHAANLSRQRPYRCRSILPQGGHGLFRALRQRAEEQAVRRRVERATIPIDGVPAFDAQALAEIWLSTASTASALGIAACSAHCASGPVRGRRRSSINSRRMAGRPWRKG